MIVPRLWHIPHCCVVDETNERRGKGTQRHASEAALKQKKKKVHVHRRGKLENETDG